MAVNSINDQTQLVGLFKDIWGNTVIEAFGFMADITKEIKFSEGQAVGGKFHIPLDVQMEAGISYSASGVTPGVTAGSTYLAANAGQALDVQVTGYNMHGRAAVTYEALFRSDTDKKAVEAALKRVVRRLGVSSLKRLEITCLHGQLGIGVISAISGSSTTRVLTMTDETWSSGIWAGTAGGTAGQGAQIDYMLSSALGTVRNTNAAMTVTSVAPASKQITISGNATDLTQLDTDVGTGSTLFFTTSSSTTEAAGLHLIQNNTGTLFNVNAANFELWAGNVYSTSTGTLSFGKILDAAAPCASYGLYDDLRFVPSPKGFEVLNTDIAALRHYDVSYKPGNNEQGSESLTFYGQTGKIRIKANPFQMDGKAVAFCPNEAERIGSTDLTFIQRHGDSERLILEASGSPSAEMRIYSFQAPFMEQPRHGFYMGGITF